MKKFILLLHDTLEKEKGYSPDEMQKLVQEHMNWVQKLSTDGTFLGGDGLMPDGKVITGKDALVKDGPYIESKEIIGGYYLLQANSIEEATVIAKECLTEHLFREFYQEVFSSLVIKFGSKHIDLIEDALQETFYKALKSWKFNNLPKQPKGWLFTVTKNYILNQLKRDRKKVALTMQDVGVEAISVKEKEESQLQLLLACTKLDLKAHIKLIFTLKAICGFGVAELANSLLISEDTIYKQLQRSKQKLQLVPKAYFDSQSVLDFSDEDINYIELIIYFMFNEGYDSVNNNSNKAINKEICFEAVRLAHLLEKFSKKESTKHLLALCYFHMARFDSRVNDANEFVSLRNQDRSKWDGELIQIGFRYLIKPTKLNRFYIEALIASIHLGSATFLETNWNEILKLYDVLLQIVDTPIIRLNRAICMFELKMNTEAIREFELIKPQLEDNYLYFSISMAEYLKDKDVELSRFWYEKSLKSTKQDFRKKLIKTKLDILNS